MDPLQGYEPSDDKIPHDEGQTENTSDITDDVRGSSTDPQDCSAEALASSGSPAEATAAEPLRDDPAVANDAADGLTTDEAAAETPAPPPPSADAVSNNPCQDAEASASEPAPPPAPAACFVMFRVHGAREAHWQERAPLSASVSTLQEAAARRLGVPAADVGLVYCGSELLASQTLQAFGVSENATVQIDVTLSAGSMENGPPSGTTAQAGAPTDALAPPASRTLAVEVDAVAGQEQRVVTVRVDAASLEAKRYLGGYRHKSNGCVYHHAETQTPRAAPPLERTPKFSRDCQTKQTRSRGAQNVREAGTQMARPDVLLDTSNDREVTPGAYFTADQLERLKIEKAVIIQRLARGWFARRRANRLRAHRDEMLAFLAEQQQAERVAAEKRRRREIERRMHPRRAADFEVLYNELEAWRLQETRKVKAAAAGKDDAQEGLRALLHKETKLLQTIDRLKQSAARENKDAQIRATLSDLSKPKSWALANGRSVSVHTPYTTRARELMQLYQGINLPLMTVEERLDVLLHVKWTVKEFDCNLTREIVDLVDREADLLNRGRSAKMLEGLRKRISSLFLTFIETPEFNPEAAKLQIVPMPLDAYVFDNVGKISSEAPAIRI